MRYPALNDLIKLADNKYSLVLATAKRAREIVDGDEPLVKIKIDNPVTIATNEISEEMIHCVHRVHTPEAELLEETNETEVLLFDAEENKDASIVME
ncbi:MAG: DNA-directed RNA polymerase subunit omega [Acetobacterium sp.]|nr:DNA-directed RNA polymerase subunit omega [uncultured Acetobacterium sp.]MBI4856892.1 DNA-directed RNA polymerase subunit omega [Acetobacterium woodii]MBU4439233.1 DNA-directed RNA polymerase subunit omega [Bacillota bacterium]MCG2729672.1 DNA-directed RNA polymerase subunit omega [Acetobacterium sp.]